jgi:glutamate/tyrosine decarboxylase-like PLP-dependent enzyme
MNWPNILSLLERVLLMSHDDQFLLLSLAKDYAFTYLNKIDHADVMPNRKALQQLNAFDEPFPIQGNNATDTIIKLATIGNQTTVNYNTGRYFGFVNGGVYPVGIAARWLADSWDQNAALDIMSPISAKLEAVAERWVIELLGLPGQTKMGLVTGTSVATLCGLAAARYRLYERLQWDVQVNGLASAPRLRIIMGKQTHGTVTKMVSLLGFGSAAIEWVECDAQGRMLVDRVPPLDNQCIVILQAGNVCTGAFDDFKTICNTANNVGAWVHIDGAFGLWAAASQQFRALSQGMELADSWSVDGHKTLNTPYDCGLILCQDSEALVHAMQQTGSYIDLAQDSQRDGMLYTPDMSRRARGIDLWAVLHHLGQQGVAELVDTLHQHAVYFAEGLINSPINVINEVVFNQVMLQCQTPALTSQLLETIQQSGVIWCGGAQWHGLPVIRISVCSWKTTRADIDLAITTISNCLADINKNASLELP